MSVSDHTMVEAWTKVLKLSRVTKGQKVTLLTSSDTHPQTLATAIAAARGLGAMVNRLDMLPVNAEKSLSPDKLAYVGTTPLTGNSVAMAALMESDLVLDLMLLLFSPEQHEILKSGTKILLAIEPPEVLARLVPTEEDRTRVLEAAKLLQVARQMHIESAAGTDLYCALGEYPLLKEYGYVDELGRWDHWPSGFLATWPNEGSANGKIILDRGDILLPMKSYVQEPISMTVKSGYVTQIEGGLDADLLNDYMDSFDDPESYAISHIGWGLQKRARWSVMTLYGRDSTIGMDARAFAGNFLFSLGPNTEAGGTRDTPCHIDIPMRNCTVSLDGNPVVKEGRLVDDKQGQLAVAP
ncbi:MAG: 2,5-dihydroxypyridine 5,6-dioxygenase [Burkholderiaceae bacterium]|nr:MAG: 2,5-dihydroxypyridine 5,6-dioxygenase [Burkholderiaceae bacterium]